MKRKSILIIALSLMMTIMASCGKVQNQNETENSSGEYNKEIVSAVDGIAGEIREFNLAGLIQYASLEDVDREKVENIMPDDSLFNLLLNHLKENAGKIEYSIESIDERGDTASAKVKFKYCNIENIIEETLSEYASEKPIENSLSEEEKETLLEQILERTIENANDVYVTKTIRIDLVKIDGKWYLKELKNDLLDVMMSNYIRTFNKLQNKINQ